MLKPLTKAIILEWLKYAQETFSVEHIWQELGVTSQEGKDALRVILWRLDTQDHVISSLGGHRYRKVDYQVTEIDWQNSDPGAWLNLKFPFGLELLCKIYSRSIIIVTGTTNTGKTAFLYNFVEWYLAFDSFFNCFFSGNCQ